MVATTSCFISGTATFLTNVVVLLLFPPLGLLTAILAPGFVFGVVLLEGKQAASNVSKLSFLLFAGGLFVAAAFCVTGHSFSWQQQPATFPLVSVAGAVGLLLVYKVLLDKAISLPKGIPLVVGASLLAAVVPAIALGSSSGLERWSNIVGVSSIYLTWQTLFGWVLHQARVPAFVDTHLLPTSDTPSPRI
ncbi:hypothetical protein [Hymenobacter bucti]|uniref:EamA domain-containing protein n=1 Tax=Hymenobacter bucti TaxID=1844114 RepID=A0ABW4R124_9BACT